jgi:hypothetical protein
VNCASVGTCGATAFCGPNQYLRRSRRRVDRPAVHDRRRVPGQLDDWRADGVQRRRRVRRALWYDRALSFATVIPPPAGTFMGTTVGGTSVLNACNNFDSRERTFE